MSIDRIPELSRTTTRGIREWFEAMAYAGLLFHPDDDPASIERIATGERVFSGAEVVRVRRLVRRMFKAKGDRVYDIALPVFHRASGISVGR